MPAKETASSSSTQQAKSSLHDRTKQQGEEQNEEEGEEQETLPVPRHYQKTAGRSAMALG